LGSLLRTEWIHGWSESHFKTDDNAVTIEICALSHLQYSSPGYRSTDHVVDGFLNRPHIGADLFNRRLALAVKDAGDQQDKYEELRSTQAVTAVISYAVLIAEYLSHFQDSPSSRYV